MDKLIIREQMLKRRNALNKEDKKSMDQRIKEQVLMRSNAWDSIGLYISLDDEIDTLSIIEELLKTKKVYAPVCVGPTLEFYQIQNLNDFVKGPFNLKEPKKVHKIEIEELDVIFVPLLAFDKRNHRIGYGKGYYDHILNSAKLKIGLAYPFQCVESIDTNEFDVALDEVII